MSKTANNSPLRLGLGLGTLFCFLLASADGVHAGGMVTVSECEDVEIQFEDAGTEYMAQKLAVSACASFARFRKLFADNPGPISVRILGSMDEWRSLTGHPWFIVATIRDHQVLTQPVSSLNRLKYPSKPVIHEIAHLFIRKVAGRAVPRWLDEGIAQWLAGDRKKLDELPGKEKIAQMEKRFNNSANNRKVTKKDYELALAMVQKLIEQLGAEVLIASVPRIAHASDPFSVLVGGKTIRGMLDSR